MNVGGKTVKPANNTVCNGLTPAESKVFAYMRLGMTNREIAVVLQRSEFTIKTQVENILAKFGARNRVQACMMIFDVSNEKPEKKYAERRMDRND